MPDVRAPFGANSKSQAPNHKQVPNGKFQITNYTGWLLFAFVACVWNLLFCCLVLVCNLVLVIWFLTTGRRQVHPGVLKCAT
jgi:hypothetical protein